MVRGSRVGTHGSDSIPVNRDRIAGGAGSWGVSAAIPPTEFEFLKTVIVGDLITLGMEHVAVTIPNLDVARTLPLFDDFLQRSECRGKVVDGDDVPAAAVEVLVSDLPRRVATKDIRLAEGCGKLAKSLLDRLIELANRLVVVTLRWSARWRWLLDLQESLDRFRAETKQ